MQYQILVDDEKGPGITQGEILERSESVHYSLDHDYARIKAHQLKALQRPSEIKRAIWKRKTGAAQMDNTCVKQ